jgi:hypothetical protein
MEEAMFVGHISTHHPSTRIEYIQRGEIGCYFAKIETPAKYRPNTSRKETNPKMKPLATFGILRLRKYMMKSRATYPKKKYVA